MRHNIASSRMYNHCYCYVFLYYKHMSREPHPMVNDYGRRCHEYPSSLLGNTPTVMQGRSGQGSCLWQRRWFSRWRRGLTSPRSTCSTPVTLRPTASTGLRHGRRKVKKMRPPFSSTTTYSTYIPPCGSMWSDGGSALYMQTESEHAHKITVQSELPKRPACRAWRSENERPARLVRITLPCRFFSKY